MEDNFYFSHLKQKHQTAFFLPVSKCFDYFQAMVVRHIAPALTEVFQYLFVRYFLWPNSVFPREKKKE